MKFYCIVLLFVIAAFTFESCDRKSVSSGNSTQEKIVEKKVTTMRFASESSQFRVGDSVSLLLTVPDTLVIDSLEVFFRGRNVGIFKNSDAVSISTVGSNPGMAGVRTRLFLSNGVTETHSSQIELLSDIVPQIFRYKVVNSYPHDVGAYTQGLIWYDGWLYEGTGNYNQSTVRKVRLENGEVIQVRNNASDIFGEGITIFNGKIYQLTYKSQICFVYDLNSFEEIQKFYFQNREGWGLTNSENELIMSDGTNILYFIDPDMFTVKRQIEVYNNEGAVMDLNELEYINGKIYANRYYTDEIVIIDPLTGKEEGRVDMKGILSVKERKPSTNVLNGIAWDSQQKRLFITGKYWPKLFEVEIIP